jgi:hypothetical protein
MFPINRRISTEPGSLTIDQANPLFTITAERAYPNEGDVLHKVGRTTGWTSGTVEFSCTNTNIAGTDITILCQEWVRATADHGDSGAPVFDFAPDGGPNDVRLTGLLWGHNGTHFVFSAMGEIRFENQAPNAQWIVFPGQEPE